MTRLLASLALAISLCITGTAGVAPGSISGYVKDSAGVAQMGATVEVAGDGGKHQVAFTDAKGFFRVSGLGAGSYDLRVSAPSFLPALREDVALAAGASKVLNITLSTLFEAIRMMPELKRSTDEDDSWKWTLRSTANRPILRFEAGGPVVIESALQDHSTTGTMAFMAGGTNEGYGSASDLGTAFKVEHSIFHTAVIGLAGDFGYPGGIPDGVIRASYSRHNEDGWNPVIAFTVRRFSTPDSVPHGGALQALAMSYSDGFSIGDLVDFQYGGDAEAIQFLGREANAFRPAGIADLHLTSDLILEYRYSTEEPNTRASKGFDSAPADLSESGPRMTMVNGLPLMENAHHHEVSLSQRIGNNKVQVAYFNDRIKDPALLGVGDIGSPTRRHFARRVFRHVQLQRWHARSSRCAVGAATPILQWNHGHGRLRLRRGAGPGATRCRLERGAQQPGTRLAAYGGAEAKRRHSPLRDALDRLVSLDQRRQYVDAG